ncbi:MAG: hypothetical protein ACLBM6_04335 [Cuspidothrix sp.]
MSSLTKKSASGGKSGKQCHRGLGLHHLSVLMAALLSFASDAEVEWMENQVVTTWFQLPEPINPPEDIVILAIDN